MSAEQHLIPGASGTPLGTHEPAVAPFPSTTATAKTPITPSRALPKSDPDLIHIIQGNTKLLQTLLDEFRINRKMMEVYAQNQKKLVAAVSASEESLVRVGDTLNRLVAITQELAQSARAHPVKTASPGEHPPRQLGKPAPGKGSPSCTLGLASTTESPPRQSPKPRSVLLNPMAAGKRSTGLEQNRASTGKRLPSQSHMPASTGVLPPPVSEREAFNTQEAIAQTRPEVTTQVLAQPVAGARAQPVAEDRVTWGAPAETVVQARARERLAELNARNDRGEPSDVQARAWERAAEIRARWEVLDRIGADICVHREALARSAADARVNREFIPPPITAREATNPQEAIAQTRPEVIGMFLEELSESEHLHRTNGNAASNKGGALISLQVARSEDQTATQRAVFEP
ncbi:hypothetical protein BDK51DRAFT_25918 [Blyttiomyces helicus]|uniref:Uncharacterized protein n=1 Tax=Blyttiomyces helicus TaxID=388810 RepID=A0A4P9WDT0_9FUNG|nr:hypothetical protein BDK51DRAFT_25918 [Blyttiomyces helicus]|eukprot:RKO89833.1 hypothetical protein BDK51DRAFT_25918 [Blyttiomyces helicus]